ncbi:MAG: hypothetical protein PHR82_07860 [Endomicrobiaceae bacterium]|nr:hypothetical protein [Endomicrobiaceae bacterium]
MARQVRQPIEEHMVENLTPLQEFLGVERVEALKDKVCELILERIKDDMEHQDYYTFIWEDDYDEVARAAKQKCKKKVQKMFEDKYLEVAQKAVDALGKELTDEE